MSESNKGNAYGSVSKANGGHPELDGIVHSQPLHDVVTAETDPSKQRRYARRKCLLGVELRPVDEGWSVFGRITTVSPAGCCVETPAAVDPGTKMEISPLDVIGPLSVVAIAVNRRIVGGSGCFSIGVKLEPDPPPSHKLREFLRCAEGTVTTESSDDRYLGHLKNH